MLGIKLGLLLSEPILIVRLGVSSPFSLGRGVLLINAHLTLQLLYPHHPMCPVCRSRRSLPCQDVSTVRTSCISCAPSPPSRSIFCFPYRSPSCAVCMEPCTFSLLGWLVTVCVGTARHARTRWHNLFFLSVLGSGPSTSVQDFTRPSVCLVDAHLVSQASARLETHKAQVSHIFFVLLLYLNALRPGFHRSQASSSSMRCRGTVTHDSASSHFLICVSLQYVWNAAKKSSAHLCRLLSVHSVWSQSQVTSKGSPSAAALFLTHALTSSFLFSMDSSVSIVSLGFLSKRTKQQSGKTTFKERTVQSEE